jgi:hypothetical protein
VDPWQNVADVGRSADRRVVESRRLHSPIVTGCYVVERLRPSEHDPGVVARFESLVLFLLNALLLTALSPFLTALVVSPSLRLLTLSARSTGARAARTVA